MIPLELLLKTKKTENLLVLAHYYTSPIIQEVADFVGDSLALAQYAVNNNAKNIVLCGVSFMAETIKILCPTSNVYVPVINSPCSLADSCDVTKLNALKVQYPKSIVITYVNSSIDVKTISDIIITSSNAVKIVNSIKDDKEIIVCPDYNLASYIKEQTKKNIIPFNGACHVHNRFSIENLKELKQNNPEAKILGHPELPKEMRDECDFLGSTSAILNYPQNSQSQKFIILTEYGIEHLLHKKYPNKIFHFVKNYVGNTNICRSMKYINEENLYTCMIEKKYLVEIEEAKLIKAAIPLKKMMELSI